MAAGYYRADFNERITVLSLNSMYMDSADESTHQDEDFLAGSWLEYQLALAEAQDRKVIIMDHVYAGSRYKGEQMWYENFNREYFRVLRKYHESVIIEVVGHDHLADLRYHSSDNVVDLKDTDHKYDFHNLLVAPGITSWEGTNPGMVKFEITEDLVPTSLEMEFLDLNPTYGKDFVEYDDLTWWHVDFASMWNVTDIDPTSLASFRKRLEADDDLTLNYLIAKLGFDFNDAT